MLGFGYLPDLLLAVLAEMGGTAAYDDLLDWFAAVFTGFTGAAVDAVFQLEKAAHAVGIHIITDG